MRKLVLLSILFIVGFKAQTDKIQVFLIGDSTLANKPPGDAPETGWGMVLQDYLESDKIIVRNHAMNGQKHHD